MDATIQMANPRRALDAVLACANRGIVAHDASCEILRVLHSIVFHSQPQRSRVALVWQLAICSSNDGLTTFFGEIIVAHMHFLYLLAMPEDVLEVVCAVILKLIVEQFQDS